MRASYFTPRNLDPSDLSAWRSGELVVGTDGHIVPPVGASPIGAALAPEADDE